MPRYKRIVLKIGTNVLATQDGGLNKNVLNTLVAQIAALKATGLEIVLVSSGAVGTARSEVSLPSDLNKVTKRQVWSSIGQVRLMSTYQELFKKHGIYAAQVLATKEDFRDRRHYINMQRCLNALLREDIVGIVNENDVISISELMFTDNDELSGLIAGLINAEALIILSTVDGVLDLTRNKLINKIKADDDHIRQYITSSKSEFGRGGMMTKVNIAQRTAKLGIDVFIANGTKPNVIHKLLDSSLECTYFPGEKNKSNIKKWLALTNSSNAKIVINKGAYEAINGTKAASLLPIGIIAIEGHFKKGDLIEIELDGKIVGTGLAKYGKKVLEKLIGRTNVKHFIHYDHLLLY